MIEPVEALMIFKNDLLKVKQQIQEDLNKDPLNTIALVETKGRVKVLIDLNLISTKEAIEVISIIENQIKGDGEKI